jgi:hypothetical protein
MLSLQFPCSNAAPLVVAGFAPGCSCEGLGDLPRSALEDSDAGARQEQRTKTKHLAFGMDQQSSGSNYQFLLL